MKLAFIPLALVLGALASPAAAECFTVFDSANRIIYRSDATPIDLSGRIGPALQALFPGGQLIISDDDRSCTFISPASPVSVMAGIVAPGGGTVSTVSGPAPGGSMGVGSPQGTSGAVGCRRGGDETRRGAPCDETVVTDPGVLRAPATAVGAARAPVAVEGPAVRRAR
jgi:hypothetical protein